MAHAEYHHPYFCHILLVEAVTGLSRSKRRDLDPISCSCVKNFCNLLKWGWEEDLSHVGVQVYMSSCLLGDKNRTWYTLMVPKQGQLLFQAPGWCWAFRDERDLALASSRASQSSVPELVGVFCRQPSLPEKSWSRVLSNFIAQPTPSSHGIEGE